jgi:hypothetical protein
MSALPPIADMCSAIADVRFVPIADIVPQKETALRRSLQIQFARYSHAMSFNRDACCASTRARAFFPSLAASVMVS